MTNQGLSKDYFSRIPSRFKAIKLLYNEGNYADVIRESQELLELLLKAWLRLEGIEPPKWHDVGPVVKSIADKLPSPIQQELDKILEFSKYLRKERENSFYGDEDLIPLESFSKDEADNAVKKIEWIIDLFKDFIQ
jgi:HEPN domain-containing protein